MAMKARHAVALIVAQSERKKSRSGQFTVGKKERGVGREMSGGWRKSREGFGPCKNENVGKRIKQLSDGRAQQDEEK